MKTVKRMTDIAKLQEEGDLSKAYINFLQKHFLQLYESFGAGKSLDIFDLDQDRYNGYIVILESIDNLRNLKIIGLNGGLLGTFPEYIEKETLADGNQLWKIGVFHGDSMLIFFSHVGELDVEAEAWMTEHYSLDKLLSEGFQRKTISSDPIDED